MAVLCSTGPYSEGPWIEDKSECQTTWTTLGGAGAVFINRFANASRNLTAAK